MAGYYRRFIKDFSKLSLPLTSLTKKGAKFVWSDKCEASFLKLKELLSNAPILVIPEGNQDFVIYTDASRTSLGAVLMQRERVVAYASRQLKPVETRYATHDLELAAIVFALKIWRHYLLGEKFILYTDHKSLKYLFSQKDLNLRQQRWLEFLAAYDLDILYTPGKGNRVVDALSRKHQAVVSMMISEWKDLSFLADCEIRDPISSLCSSLVLCSLEAHPSLLNRIGEAQKRDPEIAQLIQSCRDSGGTSILGDFNLDSFGNLRKFNRLVVPNDDDLRRSVLEDCHNSKFSIHPGGTKMYADMKRLYYWDGMKRDIANFVRRCVTCQLVKAEHQRPGGLLQLLYIPVWEWDQISMDFIDGLPRSRSGHDSLWVIVDRLTKSAHFLPVRSTRTVPLLAKLYVKEIVKLHGIPTSIVSDHDPLFTSGFWKALQKALGTQLSFSTAYHPQSDGQTERVNQILEDLLRACVLDFGGIWEDHIPLVEFSYNNSFQSSIGMAPFEALYGRPC